MYIKTQRVSLPKHQYHKASHKLYTIVQVSRHVHNVTVRQSASSYTPVQRLDMIHHSDSSSVIFQLHTVPSTPP